MAAQIIMQQELLKVMASAVAVILLLILVIPIVLFQRNEQKQRELGQ